MEIEKIKAGDTIAQSSDLLKENIEKLKHLFPELVTEDKIDFKAFKEVFGEEAEDGEEYYRFTWAGKAQARREAHKPSTGTLRPAKDESVDWDKTKNLYLEGDNLEVLKLMQKSYAGKIKMIYIDPPYNTGKDFVYKDNYKDNLQNYREVTGQVDSAGNRMSTNSESDGRYHSNWLNMIYPRLKLARNLLTEDGVIFMSIDDNEVENLKKVGNEVFGESAFITTFCWEKKKKPSFLNKNLGTKFEYILAFSKNRDKTGAFSVERTTEGKKYPFNNAGNGLATLKFPTNSVQFNLDDQIVPKQDMSEGKIKTELLNDVIIKNGKNENEFELKGEWRYSQKKLDEIVTNQEGIVISKIPFRPNHVKEGGEIKKMHNFLTIKHYGINTNEDADSEQTSLLGESFFDYSKPSGLIKLLVQAFMYNDKSGIVLDFFSGSATTADAVMQLNLEDGGKREHIQVQLQEPLDFNSTAYKAGYKTLTEIGKERIRRAAKKIAEDNPEKAKDLDLGFKVFKLDSSNIKAWDGALKEDNGEKKDVKQMVMEMESNIKNDRNEEDVLYEILIKYGLDLTLPIEEKEIAGKKVYNVGMGALFLCLSDHIPTAIAEGIGKWKEKLEPEICRVIFRDSGFKNDADKTNTSQTLKRFGIEEVRSI